MNPSLLLIPDRYKASKLYSQIPDSGAGDLAFTRANDTATRVNSAGLIEKVRTNIALFSEQFDNGFWNKIGTSFTVTANTTTAPNGTLTADTLNVSNNDNVLYASRSGLLLAGNEYTFSIYMKGTGSFSMSIRLNSVTTTTETKTLTSEWQRFSVSVTNSVPVLSVEFYLGLNTLSTYNVWGAQVESGPVATGYIATPTSSDVSVGPVANIPRIDYTGGGCGKLLLEPQRTNSITFSEQLDNAAWTKYESTITANATISPDGTLNAELILDNSANDAHSVFQILSVIPATYTWSVFAKAQNLNFLVISAFTGSHNRTWFNLANGTIGTNAAGNTATITNYGNGWYRCTVSRAYTIGAFAHEISPAATNGVFSYAGSGNGIFIWGAQLEAGSYPTSYIPTLGASVTRSADAASKTGISSLIGQTQGTIYVEEQYDASVANNGGVDDTLVALTDGTTNNLILVLHYGVAPAGYSNAVRFFIRTSNVSQVLIDSSALASGVYKIALAYSNNDVVAYINGVQIGTDTSATIPATSVVTLVDPITANAATKTVNTKSVALYPTRLTNAELATLTSL